MAERSYEEGVLRIFQKDPRYNPDAYYFVSQALNVTQDQYAGRHTGGRELLDGLRQYALQLFGPAALRTLKNWGIHRCEDFGEIVFNLVAEGLIRANEQDRREDFRDGYDFANAFPDAKAPETLLVVLCHLLFDSEQLGNLDKRFVAGDGIDLEWLKTLRLDPFITNSPPTMNQMAAFHALLEETAQSGTGARFADALSAFERFTRTACEWESKPDMMMHDLLVQLEPYVGAFAGIALEKFHLTPDSVSDFGDQSDGNFPFSSRDAASPRGLEPAPSEDDDPETPERDLTGAFGFGHAPPVARNVQVFVNRVPVDWFEISRGAGEEEVKNTALSRARVAFNTKGKIIRRTLVVQKHFYVNVCIEADSPAAGGAS
jgi:uncharacterized repeat protein (TIGR04138 family)